MDAGLGLLDWGLQEFNRGDYFAAHETLEALWRNEAGPRRTFLQGIIQLAVGLYHLGRGNLRGARLSVERGATRLRPFVPTYEGIEVGDLVAAADALAGRLADARSAAEASDGEPLVIRTAHSA